MEEQAAETYTVVEQLSESSYSKLYHVRKKDKDFLLKVPREGNVPFLEIIKKEYETSLKLQHPYLASVYEFVEESPVGESGKVIIVEEFFADFFLLLVLTKPIIPSVA